MAKEEEDKASNEDAESKLGKVTDKDADAKRDDTDTERDESADSTAPHWATKALRVFLFATLGTFLAALLFGDSIPNGLRVDFDVIAAIKLGLIAGVLSAVLRAVAAMLPLFSDD